MSQTFNARLEDVKILAGTAASRVLSGVNETSDAVALIFEAPAALDAHTYVFECADDEAFTLARVIQEGATPADLTPPAAGKARSYFTLPVYPFIRIKDQTGNVGGDRVWTCWKVLRT